MEKQETPANEEPRGDCIVWAGAFPIAHMRKRAETQTLAVRSAESNI
jgi:hypothetical protein